MSPDTKRSSFINGKADFGLRSHSSHLGLADLAVARVDSIQEAHNGMTAWPGRKRERKEGVRVPKD